MKIAMEIAWALATVVAASADLVVPQEALPDSGTTAVLVADVTTLHPKATISIELRAGGDKRNIVLVDLSRISNADLVQAVSSVQELRARYGNQLPQDLRIVPSTAASPQNFRAEALREADKQIGALRVASTTEVDGVGRVPFILVVLRNRPVSSRVSR